MVENLEEDDVFNGLGVEIELRDPDCFLKIKETLTRIGIGSNKNKKLYQTCHILHKRGRYAIMHFKEMFIMDGRDANIPDEDISRRNMIVKLLEEWDLLNILDDMSDEPSECVGIKVISFKEKDDWELIPKYNIGKK